MRLFLGIDGGQSSTTALIGDENGRVVGYGRGGPCNHVKGPEGRPKFVNAITACVRQAGVDERNVEFESACFGFSGGPADKEALLSEILRLRQTMVTNDGLIALAGAMAGGPGIIAIAGTGSIAYGRNAERRFQRAGGWGYIYGDEGGGFDLTRQAVRAALRHEEGWGPPTSLRQLLLEATGASDANDLLHRFYTTEYSRPQIASYARLVDQAAAGGDAVAHSLLMNAAQQLVTYATAVRRQLFTTRQPVRVACIGGVFRSGPLRERFRMLMELEDGAEVIEPIYGPAAGALLEAYAVAGLNPELSNLPEFEK